MQKNIITKITAFIKLVKQANTYTPTHRLADITQETPDEFTVTIQVINKNIIFTAKPEEILANDDMVDKFSPRDIRALTYLGYLGINSPKYKILAKRFCDSDSKFSFAIKHKNDSKVSFKTADQIMREKDILSSLSPNDASLVGYSVGSQAHIDEQEQKMQARQQRKINSHND
jgi:hypothetical protein